MILGIDEVGRGPWAGPLVVGAVVLGGVVIDGLTDSKKLSKKRREILDIEIREKALGIGLGWVDAEKIDEVGLSESLKIATIQAVKQITVPYNEIVIDGTVNFLVGTNKETYVTTMKKADLLVPSVSAASIIAKVARDNYMADQDKIHSGYNFKSHVGYGTKSHSDAINKFGVTRLHRLSFKPLKKFAKFKTAKKVMPDIDVNNNKVTTKQIGDSAEDVASNHLINNGHEIIERNWKTKYCEIDIVSKKRDVIYFTEVKFRKKPDQGGGIAAITPKKLRQMKFAAKFYALSYQIDDTNLRLAVIDLCNQPPVINDFLEVI
jgi:ribonuclease HII